MQLSNQTPFVARLLSVVRGEDGNVQATVVVKATFERDPAGGGWLPARGQMPIIADRLDTPFGTFHGDSFVRKDGVDVCVLGTVRPASPVRSQPLALTVDGQTRELVVFGDRRWVRAGGRLVPSSPEPFAEMPLGYSRAYGGATEHDYESCLWPDNPVGRGYYLSPEAAERQLLPNVEAKDGPRVEDWTDQPPVAGWGPYPCFWGLRAREGVEPPAEPAFGDVGRIKARLNNNAHPALIFSALRDDAEIRIRGMAREDLSFTLPRCAPRLEVQLGDTRTSYADSTLDGVFVWTDAGHVTLTRRLQFSYLFQRGQVRSASLTDGAGAPGAT